MKDLASRAASLPPRPSLHHTPHALPAKFAHDSEASADVAVHGITLHPVKHCTTAFLCRQPPTGCLPLET
eukprot:2248688-Rhodomonas_salina.1